MTQVSRSASSSPTAPDPRERKPSLLPEAALRFLERATPPRDFVPEANARLSGRRGLPIVSSADPRRPVDVVELAAARGVSVEQAERSLALTRALSSRAALTMGCGVVGVLCLFARRPVAAAAAFSAQLGTYTALREVEKEARAIGAEAPGLLPGR